MRNFIKREADKKRKLFSESYAEMVGAFKHENETTKDYNGRQLLELIQNADDAGAKFILIKIDEENQILSVSNHGEAFTKEGYRSLMIQNLSSKLKKTYIGNKGLGFRSIINWSDRIRIISNGTTVEFSEEKRKKEFIGLFKEEERLQIIKEFSFTENINPLPFLAIPIVTNSQNGNQFTTTIEIKYIQDYYEDIISQIKDLKPEVLLFLNHITKIELQGFENVNNIEIEGEKELEQPIKIGNKKWKVFEKSGLLDDKYQDKTNTEKEHFQIKIAIPEHFENETDLLFTFFPTKVNMEFPFVVHGTFDLDSGRNQLVETDKNKFVLEKLTELIIETAKKISKEKISWKPLELLNYRNENKVLSDLDFYETISKKIEELELFPCVDGKYRKICDICFYDNDFSLFIQRINYFKLFPNLLIPVDDELKQWLTKDLDLKFGKLSTNEFVTRIEQLSEKAKTLSDRVDLIYILEQNDIFHSQGEQYSLLINEKKNIINKGISVFTPPTTKSEEFDLPDFVKIDFLNKIFYTKLLNKYNLSSHKEKARELQRRLKEIVKIGSFEPVPVIEKIITETNRLVKKTPSKQETNLLVKKMIVSLFNIYRDLKETTKPDTSKVKILTKSGKVHFARDIYLSSDYPSGELTEDLFKGVFPKNLFVASRKVLGLQKENAVDVERFLLDFLEVNKHTKIVKEFIPENKYENFIFSRIDKPINYRTSSITVNKIDNFNQITEKLSKEKIIAWLIKDTFLKQQLNDSYNSDSFRFEKSGDIYGTYYYSIEKKSSYIKYQFLLKSLFDDILIGDEKLSFINDINIDYSSELFKKHQITPNEINNILIELGAKENFADLSIERVSKIIKSLKAKDPKGKNSQKLYKLAFEHYRKNKQLLLQDSETETELFSIKGNDKGYFPSNEVYYTDNIKLPRKIITQKPILNFPKRVGEEQVSSFFRINTFKDFNLQVKFKETSKDISEQLNDYLRIIKPYLLAIRLNKITPEKQKQINREVNYIKSLNIEICNRISCVIENKEIELEEFDFINEGSNFYIKTNSFYNLNSLKNNSTICDIISEIVTIAFRVNDNKSDFRFYFKNDIKDTEHSIISEYGNEILQEAKSLLGISDFQKEFWQVIFSIKKKTLNRINIQNDLSYQIKTALSNDFSHIVDKIDYQFISDINNYSLLFEIFNKLNISIEKYNSLSNNKIDLTEYHTKKLINRFFNNEKKFKTLLWNNLNKKPKGSQTNFLDLIYQYENNFHFITENSKEFREDWSPNYSIVFMKFLKKKFSFFVLPNEEIDVLKLYEKNKAYFNNKENDIIEQDKEMKSLLYFDKNIETLKEKLKEFLDIEDTINEDENSDENGNIISDFTVNPLPSPSSSAHDPFIPSGNTTNNKRVGNRSEKIVFNKLVKLYSENFVSWKSKEDEGLHYDMRYSPDKGTSWKFVEVKTYSNKKFYLSKEEKKFGEERKDNYEIWLVDNKNNIYPYKMFTGEKKYEITPKDFIVSLEIMTD